MSSAAIGSLSSCGSCGCADGTGVASPECLEDVSVTSPGAGGADGAAEGAAEDLGRDTGDAGSVVVVVVAAVAWASLRLRLGGPAYSFSCILISCDRKSSAFQATSVTVRLGSRTTARRVSSLISSSSAAYDTPDFLNLMKPPGCTACTLRYSCSSALCLRTSIIAGLCVGHKSSTANSPPPACSEPSAAVPPSAAEAGFTPAK